MSIKVSIVASMYNRRESVLEVIDKLFLPSLINNASKDMEFILVDDASPLSKETDEMVNRYKSQLKSKFDSFRYIKNNKNLGFSGGYNKGMRLAKGELILMTNDDVYFPKGSIKKLCETARKNKKVGIVGPVTNFASAFQNTKLFRGLSSYSSEELERIEKFSGWLGRVMKNKEYYVDKMIGFCLVYKKSILNKIGYLNENYAYVEDDELNSRMVKNGYSILLDADVFVEHGGVAGGSISISQNRFKAYKKYITSSIKFSLTQKSFIKSIYRLTVKNLIQIQDYGLTVSKDILVNARKKGLLKEMPN